MRFRLCYMQSNWRDPSHYWKRPIWSYETNSCILQCEQGRNCWPRGDAELFKVSLILEWDSYLKLLHSTSFLIMTFQGIRKFIVQLWMSQNLNRYHVIILYLNWIISLLHLIGELQQKQLWEGWQKLPLTIFYKEWSSFFSVLSS